MGEIESSSQPLPNKTAVDGLSVLLAQQPIWMPAYQAGARFKDERRKPNPRSQPFLTDFLRETCHAVREIAVELEPTADVLLEAIVDLEKLQRQPWRQFSHSLQVFVEF